MGVSGEVFDFAGGMSIAGLLGFLLLVVATWWLYRQVRGARSKRLAGAGRGPVTQSDSAVRIEPTRDELLCRAYDGRPQRLLYVAEDYLLSAAFTMSELEMDEGRAHWLARCAARGALTCATMCVLHFNEIVCDGGVSRGDPRIVRLRAVIRALRASELPAMRRSCEVLCDEINLQREEIGKSLEAFGFATCAGVESEDMQEGRRDARGLLAR